MASPQTEDSATKDICPICGGSAEIYCRKTAFDRDWRLSRCTVCRHGFVANRPTQEILADVYARDEKHADIGEHSVEDARNDPDAIAVAEMITRLTQARGPSLDVGCGTGAFSIQLKARGFSPVMIDLDPRAKACTAQLPWAEFQQIGFEEFKSDRRFDAIIMSQVLEHSLDPMAWLKRAAELLSPTGVLAIALPNFSSVYRVLGERDPFITPPVHLNYFSPRSMELAVEKSGLRILKREFRSGISTTHPTRKFSLKRRVLGKTWNGVVRPLLDCTKAGIIMRVFVARMG